jgi:hypothetical protein
MPGCISQVWLQSCRQQSAVLEVLMMQEATVGCGKQLMLMFSIVSLEFP